MILNMNEIIKSLTKDCVNVLITVTANAMMKNLFLSYFERYAGRNIAVIPTMNRNAPTYRLLASISTA